MTARGMYGTDLQRVEVPEWMDRAACRGLATGDHDPWHPVGCGEAPVMYAVARRVCAVCPVRLECLYDGLRLLETSQVLGMWGGLTPEELRRFAREVGTPARKVAAHGTRARYINYTCRCGPCRAANAREEHRRRLETPLANRAVST